MASRNAGSVCAVSDLALINFRKRSVTSKGGDDSAIVTGSDNLSRSSLRIPDNVISYHVCTESSSIVRGKTIVPLGSARKVSFPLLSLRYPSDVLP